MSQGPATMLLALYRMQMQQFSGFYKSKLFIDQVISKLYL